MARSMMLALAATLGLAVPECAMAKDEIVLAPSSPWVVDFSEDRCTIVRQFGEGDETLYLRISQYMPASSLELVLMGDNARLPFDYRLGGARNHPLSVSFGPEIGISAVTDAIQAEAGETQAIIATQLSFIPDEAEDADLDPDRGFINDAQRSALSQMDRIEIGGSITKSHVLMTGPMYDVFKVLDDCTYDLVEQLGLDAAASRNRLSKPVIDEAASMIVRRRMQMTYPAARYSRGQMAILRVRLIVEADGKVGDCLVIGTTDIDGFGEGVCDTFRANGQYTPAIGSNGEPLRSWDMVTIRYLAR